MELEGVLAHELSHVKNYDILVSTLAVTMVGVVALLADLGVRTLWWGGGRNRYSEYDRHGGGGGRWRSCRCSASCCWRWRRSWPRSCSWPWAGGASPWPTCPASR